MQTPAGAPPMCTHLPSAPSAAGTALGGAGSGGCRQRQEGSAWDASQLAIKNPPADIWLAAAAQAPAPAAAAGSSPVNARGCTLGEAKHEETWVVVLARRPWLWQGFREQAAGQWVDWLAVNATSSKQPTTAAGGPQHLPPACSPAGWPAVGTQSWCIPPPRPSTAPPAPAAGVCMCRAPRGRLRCRLVGCGLSCACGSWPAAPQTATAAWTGRAAAPGGADLCRGGAAGVQAGFQAGEWGQCCGPAAPDPRVSNR